MRLAQFCKNQGMTLEQYRAYKISLEEKAQKIYDTIVFDHLKGTGMYFSLADYVDIDTQESRFVMQFLQEIGLEIFYETLEFRI